MVVLWFVIQIHKVSFQETLDLYYTALASYVPICRNIREVGSDNWWNTSFSNAANLRNLIDTFQ